MGQLVDLFCDGGFMQGVHAVGFCVVELSRNVLRSMGDLRLGFSNNQCECFAMLHMLEYAAA